MSPFQIVTGPNAPNDPQRQRSLTRSVEGPSLALIRARWVQFMPLQASGDPGRFNPRSADTGCRRDRSTPGTSTRRPRDRSDQKEVECTVLPTSANPPEPEGKALR